MTETGLVLTNPIEPIEARVPGHVGKPFPGVEVALLDSDGKMHSKSDREGELLVRSLTNFSGYLDDAEATKEAYLDGGWFKTGDCALFNSSLDSYKILGRMNEDIISNALGEKISTLEIEEAILQYEAVEEVAVVGVDEQIVAFVVSKRRVRAQQIIEHCADLLDEQMLPTEVKFVESLPRNALGKVLKDQLK